MSCVRVCALVPTYQNQLTLRAVVQEIRMHLTEVFVVDDGSTGEARLVAQRLASDGLAHVRRRERNGGKGAAVKTGLALAAEHGFTHALQIDADGQHQTADIPAFVEAARTHPSALVLGVPVFDLSAPPSRVRGRAISRFWTDLETAGRVIQDPLCGFRAYPIAPALAVAARGDRMDFDVEIAVRLVWSGCAVISIPTRVRYLSPEEGGVSHFRMLRDNALISWTHTRLCCEALLRVLTGKRLHQA
jgi:glycosyltransferase involved in cell wall biosynthesis